jgi:hypothetical protein
MGGADLFVILFGAPLLLLAISIPLLLLQTVFRGGLRFSGWVMRWVGRYRNFHQRQPPREAELSKASHGAAVLAIVALALHGVGAARIDAFLTGLRTAPENPWYFIPALAIAGLVGWGLLWTVTGARRAFWFASFRDGRLITRALVKIASGVGVYAVLWNPPAGWSPDVLAWIATARNTAGGRFVIEALVLWLTVTGLAKMVLVFARRISRAREQVTVDIAAQQFNWDDMQ